LYPFTNINVIKKIESSEITRKTLAGFQRAMDNLSFFKDRAYIYMGRVDNPDILVIIADFFLKMAEATWSIVSGVYGNKLVIIFRNVGFRLDAGKTASKLFGELGSAGGHRSAARAEVPLDALRAVVGKDGDIHQFILGKIREM
ncbi:MAG: DHH family phosphoesterase, partial [Deltaproteobacteria bacterium]|nr:DHH family phosphoesterase [Deltaproteobacteria bacterium]